VIAAIPRTITGGGSLDPIFVLLVLVLRPIDAELKKSLSLLAWFSFLFLFVDLIVSLDSMAE
jgi:hypothetical protein